MSVPDLRDMVRIRVWGRGVGQRVIRDKAAHEEDTARAGNIVGKDRAERTQSLMALICSLVTLKSIAI